MARLFGGNGLEFGDIKAVMRSQKRVGIERKEERKECMKEIIDEIRIGSVSAINKKNDETDNPEKKYFPNPVEQKHRAMMDLR